VRIMVERQTEQRRITADHLAHWFGAGGGRLSYGERLAAGGLTGEEVERVATLYRRELEGKVVGWNGRLVYVVAGHK
jgi:hypothetical protein